MFLPNLSGTVSDLTPNSQTRFQCTVTLTLPIDDLPLIEPGRLIATENLTSAPRSKRYTVLQILGAFPAQGEAKRGSTLLACTAMPIGCELRMKGKEAEIVSDDTFPLVGGAAEVLTDDATRDIIHQIAPDSRVEVNGSRIDIGTYRSNPNVKVGMDAATLLRGNAAVISARPRARTTITTSLVQALLQGTEQPVHIVYCDVNNQGTMSLAPLLSDFPHSSVLCLNDKFVPSSLFSSMKNPGDRSAHKRAVLDYLDMMILPSVLENRRHDCSYAVSNWLRENRIAVFRPNEQTVDAFINDIRVDILDGVDEDVEEYISGLMNGMAETYRGERFNEKNTRDLLDMVEEFSQDSKSHSARRTLYDLKAEIQSVFESYSKDIPAAVRRSLTEVINELNSDERSSLLVVQGQKPTDIMRFVGTLTQTLIEERLKRLKIRTPVLFIFNNIDEYVGRGAVLAREAGAERFYDILQTLIANGRRHGLGFCLTLESAASLDRSLARRVQSYFIGPITFVEEPAHIADLLNLSEDLVRPAVHYEDGDFLFASADSPYHRRVPLPVCTEKSTTAIHNWLDGVRMEAERRRQEYLAPEEERRKRQDQEREERRRQQEKAAEEKAKADAEKAKADAEKARADAEKAKAEAERTKAAADTATDEENETDADGTGKASTATKSGEPREKRTTRDRRKRGGRRTKEEQNADTSGDALPFNEDADTEERDMPEPDDDAPAVEAPYDDDGGDDAMADDADDSGEAADDAPASTPVKKSTRGRRGRGKAKSAAAKTEDKAAPVKAEGEGSTEPAPAPPAGSTSRSLTIEDFDPNAGKKSAPPESSTETPAEAGSEKDATDGKDAAEKKAPARRGGRRRSTRGKKSDG